MGWLFMFSGFSDAKYLTCHFFWIASQARNDGHEQRHCEWGIIYNQTAGNDV